MALLIDAGDYSSNSAGDEYYIPDATGVYDVDDNPGGYGDPNPERVQVGLFLVPYYKNEEEDDEYLAPEDNDPISVETFTIKPTKDSWIEAKMYGVLVKTGSETEGQACYNSVDGVLEAVIDDEYVEIEPIDLADYEDEVAYTTTNVAVLSYSTIKKLTLNKEIADKVRNRKDQKEYDFLLKRWQVVHILQESAKNDFCVGAYYEYLKTVETLNQYITDYE